MAQIDIDRAKLAAFCRRHHIRKLSLFGSVLGTDFRPESDVDVLVEFDPEHVPGFLALARMEGELSELLGGHNVDMRTPRELSRYFRDDVLAAAEVQYAAADVIRLLNGGPVVQTTKRRRTQRRKDTESNGA